MPPALSVSSRESSVTNSQEKASKIKTKSLVMVVVEKASVFAFPEDIDEIICHREHQFLVRWKTSAKQRLSTTAQPYSWIRLCELKGPSSSLVHVQEYVEKIRVQRKLEQAQYSLELPYIDNKRKESPLLENGNDLIDRPSPKMVKTDQAQKLDRTSRNLFAAPMKQNGLAFDFQQDYNCRRSVSNNRFIIEPVTTNVIDNAKLPTITMQERARRTSLDWAEAAVADEYKRILSTFARYKPRIRFVNHIDNGSPPLRVELIDQYIYGDGVAAPDDATLLGCQEPCKPNMAHNCGCEYSRTCSCLEFAEVDAERLRAEDLEQYEATAQGADGDTMGLPKRFPYKLDGTMQSKCLTSTTRWTLYECNDKCNCGPDCKSKVTQRGRRYPLEIFKTENRGWGLRSTKDLRKGDFIDMYFGKVITSGEADERDDNAYHFKLDKWESQIPEEAILVVDGTDMGGVSRFMNHSCEPNCAIYSVSYNKYDMLRYNLAFFAQDAIPAGEELTFDYTGQTAYVYDPKDFTEAPSSSQKQVKSRMVCYCGAETCKGYLFM